MILTPPNLRTRKREKRSLELLQANPSMPATVIAERISWPYSVRTLSGRVAKLRPVYLPPDPASQISYTVGEIAQCNFRFSSITVPAGSRQARTAGQLPTRQTEDLFVGG